jgi:sugar phosphate isomerase/epimerase
MIPPRSAAEDKRILLDSLSRLNEVAAKHNVTVFLEPLNRYEDHMINTLEQARDYIDEGSFTHIALIADFYHMNIEEAHMDESILAQKNFIRHIHLADNHRYQPGSGHTDFASGFSALKAIGYTGAMAFECRVQGDDAAAAYQFSLQFIRNLITKIWSAE